MTNLHSCLNQNEELQGLWFSSIFTSKNNDNSSITQKLFYIAVYSCVNLFELKLNKDDEESTEPEISIAEARKIIKFSKKHLSFINLVLVFINLNQIDNLTRFNYFLMLLNFLLNIDLFSKSIIIIFSNLIMCIRTYGIHNFVVFNWTRLKVPSILRLYFIFKVVNFLAQFYFYLNEDYNNDSIITTNRISFKQLLDNTEDNYQIYSYFFYTLVLYLTNTLISIFALTSTLSYAFFLMAKLLRLYLYPQLHLSTTEAGNVDVDDLLDIGEITAVLFLILSVQSSITQLYGIDRLKKLIKNFLLLCIALLHFLHRILDQQLMQLSATTSYKQINKSNETDLRGIILKKRHFRNLVLSICLILLPIVFLNALWWNCNVSTWLLAATCFNLELLIKMSVSLVIYTLFIIDSRRLKNMQENSELLNNANNGQLWDNFDDYIYYIKSFGRICEFLFAIFLFFNSLYILLFESYGSIRAIMMGLYYFHIYLQATKGWNEFIKHYTAVSKMKQLPIYVANNNEEDVCPICYADIRHSEARITVCKHIFHSICLRKWLYIQDTCPMCQKVVYPGSKQQQQQQNLDINDD